MTMLPEGVELTVSVYVASDSQGLRLRLNLTGNVELPSFPSPVDVVKLIDGINPGLSRIAKDWRVMTREEIDDYKQEAAEEGEDELS